LSHVVSSLAPGTFPTQNKDTGWTQERHISNQQIRYHGNSNAIVP
jgi:hypothetical protein